MVPALSLACGLALLSALAPVRAADVLGPYSISDVTVSGLSSGGYMAVQMHVAFSSIVSGSAIFAGGPFYCAQGTVDFAENRCMKTTQGLPLVSELVKLTHEDDHTGAIDPVKNLRDDRVFLFSGRDDSVVEPPVVGALQSYYSAFMPSTSIATEFNLTSEHLFPTLDYGQGCSTLSSPYIGKCGFDGAGAAFRQLFGALAPRVPMVQANYHRFSQTPFFVDPLACIGEVGSIYVPSSCQGKSAVCHLHVSFHGCLQNLDAIADEYAEHVGLNEWAEANGIIVLYPYVTKSTTVPYNPNGCWDWWGYTHKVDYGVKAGVQMQFVRALLAHVTGKSLHGQSSA